MDESNTRRIVLLGKTGCGKSSLANTIFGEELFKIDHTLNSETREYKAETKSVNGKSFTLIDTPGFYDTDRSEEKLKPDTLRCICAPGTHVFLVVLKVEKVTEHEQAVMTKMFEHFSQNAPKYAAVVFTHGDDLPKKMKIEEFISQNKNLSYLVEMCGGRCHVVDNRYWKSNKQDEYRSNQVQVAELLNTIEKIVKKNNGGYYTDKMLQTVERAIQKEEERIRESSGNMSEEEIRKLAKDNVWSNTRRIAILGKTGAGKSSVANTIFGEKLFKIGDTLESETSRCQAETKSVNQRNITLIDTPGFFNTDRSEDELKCEIVRCITECSPGPHAFLIVLKVEKYTEQDQAVINKICQYFSDEAFKYATVVFTHGEQLREGQTIEDFVVLNKSLSDLVQKCGGRCHVIDNKYWKENPNDEYRSNQFQVGELLSTIDKMMKVNNESCYTNEMLQAVEKQIQEEEENIKQSSPNVSKEEVREQAEDNVSSELSDTLTGTGIGGLLGGLFGGGGGLVALFVASTPVGALSVAGAAAAGAAVAGAVIGGVVGYCVSGGSDTQQEEAKRAAEDKKRK